MRTSYEAPTSHPLFDGMRPFHGSASSPHPRTHLLAGMSPPAGGLFRDERIAPTSLEIESAVSLMNDKLPCRASPCISPFRAKHGVRLSRMHRRASLAGRCVHHGSCRCSGCRIAHEDGSLHGHALFLRRDHALFRSPQAFARPSPYHRCYCTAGQ